MRAAGCIVNDMADREIDKHVERTKSRPLASGELSLTQAAILLGLLLAVSFGIALAMGDAVVLWSLASLPMVVLYPFMKRITWWPQLFLGLTFNWGTLLGWVAVRASVEFPALLLYAGGVCWTLGYDTIYAHQDKADDAKVGIKSTALRLGMHTKIAVSTFYLAAVTLWTFASIAAHPPHTLTYALLGLAFMHMAWQAHAVNLDDPASCRRVFVSNAALGAIVAAAFLIS